MRRTEKIEELKGRRRRAKSWEGLKAEKGEILRRAERRMYMASTVHMLMNKNGICVFVHFGTCVKCGYQREERKKDGEDDFESTEEG